MTKESQDIVTRVQRTIGESPAALHEPDLSEYEVELAVDCIRSSFISTVSPYVNRFEATLAATLGSPNVLATNSGTSALQLALLVLGVRPGDEVLCTALSFAASANAIAYCGATPHFVDVEDETFGMCPDALKASLASMHVSQDGTLTNPTTGATVRAVLVVHIFGQPCQIDALQALAGSYGLLLIEDAAEALGSQVDGRSAGTIGAIGCLSFNGNKIATTGAGGALVTNNSSFAEQARHLASLAKAPHLWHYRHTEVGFNYRMPGLNAAVGCAQLERLDAFLAQKRALHLAYSESFQDCEYGKLHGEASGTSSNFWLNTLVLDGSISAQLDTILQDLHNSGLGARPVWQLLSNLPQFARAPRGDLSTAVDLSRRIVNLPSGMGLSARLSTRNDPLADS